MMPQISYKMVRLRPARVGMLKPPRIKNLCEHRLLTGLDIYAENIYF